MTSGLVLGVDGGGTKTVALVAGPDGTVHGAARGGRSDIYTYPDPAEAVAVLADVVDRATAAAGADRADLSRAVLCLAGADWPEDVALLEDALTAALPGCPVEVLHDAQGLLWAGHPDGVGVTATFGTGLAIGARNADGRAWSSANWLEPSGSAGLAHDGIRAAFDAHLGVAPDTVLTDRLPARAGLASVPDLAHRLTGRQGLEGSTGVRMPDLGPVVLDAAAGGDPVARRIVDRHVGLLVGYVGAAARQVGLPEPLHVVLGGGPTRHPAGAVLAGLRAALGERGGTVTRCHREPVAGAVVKALHDAGTRVDAAVLDRLDATAPAGSFYATLAPGPGDRVAG